MPVKHGILKEELIDQHGVTFNFKQKKNMKIKAKKVYCSSIYVIDYFYSRVPLSPEVDRSTTGWHFFKERQSLAADTEIHFVESFRKQELNEFHSICGVTPVTMEWTKRRNITEASGAMVANLQTLSPSYHGELWDELGRSENLCEAFNTAKTNKFGSSQSVIKYLPCRRATPGKTVRKQIISIMVDVFTYEEIRPFIPGLTKYTFCEVRKCSSNHGCGTLVALKSVPRCKTDQAGNFLSFLTSPSIVQDFPFSEKVLKLLSGEVVQTPNVIRMSVNERIIKQYLQNCEESGTDSLSSSTLPRILTACKASTTTSLQGLDWIRKSLFYIFFVLKTVGKINPSEC